MKSPTSGFEVAFISPSANSPPNMEKLAPINLMLTKKK